MTCSASRSWATIPASVLLLFGIIVVLAWGYPQVFSAGGASAPWRADGDVMTANVAMIIIPNQQIVVADLKAGRTPDPKYRQDRQAALHSQQLPDAAGHLPDAVEPLPAGLASEWTG